MSAANEWIGIDVGGRRKGFHVAVIDDELRLVELARFGAADVLSRALPAHVRMVAVDAPAEWAPPGERSRPCERSFARSRVCGIRFTPDEATAARRADGYFEWIECGLDLWARLRQLDIPVVEGFPTASWTAWLGPPARSTRAVWTTRGLEWLRVQGVTGLDGVRNQDERDAVAAALTARQAVMAGATVLRFGALVVPTAGSSPVGVPSPICEADRP